MSDSQAETHGRFSVQRLKSPDAAPRANIDVVAVVLGAQPTGSKNSGGDGNEPSSPELAPSSDTAGTEAAPASVSSPKAAAPSDPESPAASLASGDDTSTDPETDFSAEDCSLTHGPQPVGFQVPGSLGREANDVVPPSFETASSQGIRSRGADTTVVTNHSNAGVSVGSDVFSSVGGTQSDGKGPSLPTSPVNTRSVASIVSTSRTTHPNIAPSINANVPSGTVNMTADTPNDGVLYDTAPSSAGRPPVVYDEVSVHTAPPSSQPPQSFPPQHDPQLHGSYTHPHNPALQHSVAQHPPGGPNTQKIQGASHPMNMHAQPVRGESMQPNIGMQPNTGMQGPPQQGISRPQSDGSQPMMPSQGFDQGRQDGVGSQQPGLSQQGYTHTMSDARPPAPQHPSQPNRMGQPFQQNPLTQQTLASHGGNNAQLLAPSHRPNVPGDPSSQPQNMMQQPLRQVMPQPTMPSTAQGQHPQNAFNPEYTNDEQFSTDGMQSLPNSGKSQFHARLDSLPPQFARIEDQHSTMAALRGDMGSNFPSGMADGQSVQGVFPDRQQHSRQQSPQQMQQQMSDGRNVGVGGHGTMPPLSSGGTTSTGGHFREMMPTQPGPLYNNKMSLPPGLSQQSTHPMSAPVRPTMVHGPDQVQSSAHPQRIMHTQGRAVLSVPSTSNDGVGGGGVVRPGALSTPQSSNYKNMWNPQQLHRDVEAMSGRLLALTRSIESFAALAETSNGQSGSNSLFHSYFNVMRGLTKEATNIFGRVRSNLPPATPP